MHMLVRVYFIYLLSIYLFIFFSYQIRRVLIAREKYAMHDQKHNGNAGVRSNSIIIFHEWKWKRVFRNQRIPLPPQATGQLHTQ